MMSERPIGIFDSGVGGLSILKAIREHLPNENLLYFADSKYAPYGKLDEKTLKQRCLFIADFFAKHNAKAMVIACNTATALMAEWLRAEYEMPIIAIEPAIKPAASVSKHKKVGVFATRHTLNSERYQSLKQRFAQDIEILESDCPGFVEQVEKGQLDTLETVALVEQQLIPMLEAKIDTLVLGCTHYPFLRNTIKIVAGKHPLTIIDNADAVSLQLTRILTENHLLNLQPHKENQYYSSGDTELQQEIFSLLVTEEEPIKVIPQ